MTGTSDLDTKPWYRQFWPWFLIAGPATVVVAAFVSAWIAVSSDDGLVSDEYYKEGLKASETLAKSDHARDLGLVARMSLAQDALRIRLSASSTGFVAPPMLRATLSHPTRAGVDQYIDLNKAGEFYAGALNLPSSGHWLILIEDDAKTWRLMASVQLPSSGELVIGGETPADIRN